MNSKLYVGNMSFKTTEADLRAAFSQFGTVSDVFIANDRETCRPRGFAFVTMGTAEESKAAIEKMNGVDLDGRQLTVNEAKPKEEMGGGGGGGRNFSSPNRRPGAFQSRY
jgi:RNA recognition motif-containing protein